MWNRTTPDKIEFLLELKLTLNFHLFQNGFQFEIVFMFKICVLWGERFQVSRLYGWILVFSRILYCLATSNSFLLILSSGWKKKRNMSVGQFWKDFFFQLERHWLTSFVRRKPIFFKTLRIRSVVAMHELRCVSESFWNDFSGLAQNGCYSLFRLAAENFRFKRFSSSMDLHVSVFLHWPWSYASSFSSVEW